MKQLGMSALKSTLLVGALGLLGAVSANAVTVNSYSFGTLTPAFNSIFITDALGTFEDDITFTISPPNTNTGIAASTLTLLNPFGSPLVAYSSFNAVIDDSSSALVASLTPNGNSFLFNGNLGAGTYTLKVTGEAIGSGFGGPSTSGAYSVSMAALPVPEASTALSAIAGLGMLALVTRRRRFN